MSVAQRPAFSHLPNVCSSPRGPHSFLLLQSPPVCHSVGGNAGSPAASGRRLGGTSTSPGRSEQVGGARLEEKRGDERSLQQALHSTHLHPITEH